jgi:hypothetical protein
MTKTNIVTIAALAAVVGVVVYSSVGLGMHQCEICVRFDGRESCRTVEAATEDEARMGATTNACALVSSGVTDTLRCQRTPPVRESCTAMR